METSNRIRQRQEGGWVTSQELLLDLLHLRSEVVTDSDQFIVFLSFLIRAAWRAKGLRLLTPGFGSGQDLLG